MIWPCYDNVSSACKMSCGENYWKIISDVPKLLFYFFLRKIAFMADVFNQSLYNEDITNWLSKNIMKTKYCFYI